MRIETQKKTIALCINEKFESNVFDAGSMIGRIGNLILTNSVFVLFSLMTMVKLAAHMKAKQSFDLLAWSMIVSTAAGYLILHFELFKGILRQFKMKGADNKRFEEIFLVLCMLLILTLFKLDIFTMHLAKLVNLNFGMKIPSLTANEIDVDF